MGLGGTGRPRAAWGTRGTAPHRGMEGGEVPTAARSCSRFWGQLWGTGLREQHTEHQCNAHPECGWGGGGVWDTRARTPVCVNLCTLLCVSSRVSVCRSAWGSARGPMRSAACTRQCTLGRRGCTRVGLRATLHACGCAHECECAEHPMGTPLQVTVPWGRAGGQMPPPSPLHHHLPRGPSWAHPDPSSTHSPSPSSHPPC